MQAESPLRIQPHPPPGTIPRLHAGHEDHAEMFRGRFWVSLALTSRPSCTAAWSRSGWATPRPSSRAHLRGAAVRDAGVPLGRPGLPARRVGGAADSAPGMMLLISMGVLVAFGASVATELGWIDVDLWFELVDAGDGHAARPLAGDASHRPGAGALAALAELLPDEADGSRRRGVGTVRIDELRVGDVVLVRAGAGCRPTG